MDLSCIEDGLYQGAMTDVEPPPGIDVIVNVRRTPNNFLASVGLTALLHFPIVDHAFPGVAWLEMVVDCIAACRSRGQSVLVHCASGQSRSSLVVLGYLMKSKVMGREEALALLVQRRPCADPNHRFWDGLVEFERSCEITVIPESFSACGGVLLEACRRRRPFASGNEL